MDWLTDIFWRTSVSSELPQIGISPPLHILLECTRTCIKNWFVTFFSIKAASVMLLFLFAPGHFINIMAALDFFPILKWILTGPVISTHRQYNSTLLLSILSIAIELFSYSDRKNLALSRHLQKHFKQVSKWLRNQPLTFAIFLFFAKKKPRHAFLPLSCM